MDRVLSWARVELWGAPAWRWGLAILVAVVVFIALLSLRRWISKRLERAIERRGGSDNTRLDDFALEPVRAIHGVFLLAFGLYLGAVVAPLHPHVDRAIDTAMVVASLLQAGLLGQALTAAVIARWLGERKEVGSATLAAGLRFAAQLLIWAAVVLLVLSNLGVEITALVAGLGVGGVAAALAVQNVLGDLFASLAIYFDRPFDIGDFIVVGDDMGNVTKIGMRSTRVRALGGEEIVFPNANLMQSRIHNFRRMAERRVVLQLGVTYGTSAEELTAAARIVRESIEAAKDVRLDRAHFKGFGASSLDLEAVYWVLSPEYNVFMDRQQEINLAILQRFEEAGLDFAFPTRTLHLASSSALTIENADGRGEPGDEPEERATGASRGG